MPVPSRISPFALLFLSNLSILFVGMGLFPVLPLYAAQFGASQTLIGLFFASLTAALSAGSLVSGYLAVRFPLRTVYIVSGLAGAPALILLGQASALWQVVALTSLVWFFGGLNLALIHILLGMSTVKESRGRYFSLLALAVPLGALFGGAAVGGLVAAFDYAGMLFGLSLVWLLVPLAGVLIQVNEPDPAAVQTGAPAQKYRLYSLDEPFAAVLFISLLAAAAISFARLAAPLAMKLQEFSASELASTAMVSGLISIPFVLLSSRYSDRISRSRSLILAYLSAAIGMLILVFANQLWHYWVSGSFVMVAFCLNGAIASAAASDVLPPHELKRGLAWLNTAIPAASILAYAATGLLAEIVPLPLLFLGVTALPLASAGLMEAALQRCRRAYIAPMAEPVLEPPIWEENAYFKRCL
jgi:MFS family permease